MNTFPYDGQKKSELKFSYCLYWQLYIWLAAILYACKVRDRLGSYVFSGEKFEDFSRIFQDPTLIYINLPSTKQNVCVESYVLGINTCTYKNARQRELENTCKPNIHCALVGQFHMRESNEKAMPWEKTSVFTHFVRISRISFSVSLYTWTFVFIYFKTCKRLYFSILFNKKIRDI